MVLSRELEIIFRLAYGKKVFTVSDLENCGLRSHEISKLIIQGYIKKDEEGNITILNTDRYIQYKEFKESGRTDLFIMPNEEQIVYDLMFKKQYLNSQRLQDVGLSTNEIEALVERGFLEPIPSTYGTYRLTHTRLFETYKEAALMNPALTISISIRKYLKKIYTIFDFVIDGEKLTFEKLKTKGLNQEDVNVLIKNGIITEIRTKEYAIADFWLLFIYGNYLRTLPDPTKGIECHKICYILDTKRALFSTVLDSILLGFSGTFSLLTYFQKASKTSYEKDFNLYLYILSFLNVFPSNLIEYTKKLQLDDITIESGGPSYIPNELRKLIFAQKFQAALTYIDSNYSQEETIPREIAIIRRILKDISLDYNSWKKQILEAINDKDIDQLFLLLQKESMRHKLATPFNYFLAIAKDIRFIRQRHTLPQCQRSNNDSLSELIKTKRYVSAYFKSIVIAYTKGKDDRENHLGTILELMVIEMIKCSTQPWVLLKEIKKNFNVDDVLTLKMIEKYIELFNLKPYAPIIRMLFEIYATLGEITENEIIYTLKKLVTGNFSPISFYFNKATQAKMACKIELASKYFDILLGFSAIDNSNEFEEKISLLQVEIADLEKDKEHIILPLESESNPS